MTVPASHRLDSNGHHLFLGQTQDTAGPHCPDCGRSVYDDTQPHSHAVTCPSYEPHPDSVAAARTCPRCENVDSDRGGDRPPTGSVAVGA